MTRTILKPLLAAAVAVTGLAVSAEAHPSMATTLSRMMMVQPHVARTIVPHTFRRTTISPIYRAPLELRPIYLDLDCIVAGTPVEFPNDIRISNPYNFTISAGTVVAYNAPYGNSGTVVLPALVPGAGVYVSNAVPGGVTAGAGCSAGST